MRCQAWQKRSGHRRWHGMYHIARLQQTSTCKTPTKGAAIALLQNQGQQRGQNGGDGGRSVDRRSQRVRRDSREAISRGHGAQRGERKSKREHGSTQPRNANTYVPTGNSPQTKYRLSTPRVDSYNMYNCDMPRDSAFASPIMASRIRP